MWLRENQFEPSLAFSLGLEVLFGEKYLKNVQEELLPPGEGDARGGVLVRRDYRYRNFNGNDLNLPALSRDIATDTSQRLPN